MAIRRIWQLRTIPMIWRKKWFCYRTTSATWWISWWFRDMYKKREFILPKSNVCTFIPVVHELLFFSWKMDLFKWVFIIWLSRFLCFYYIYIMEKYDRIKCQNLFFFPVQLFGSYQNSAVSSWGLGYIHRRSIAHIQIFKNHANWLSKWSETETSVCTRKTHATCWTVRLSLFCDFFPHSFMYCLKIFKYQAQFKSQITKFSYMNSRDKP